MELTILKKMTLNAHTLHVNAGVRYWEDSTINGVTDEEGTLTPCRDGDYWKPIIDIDKGVIVNWEKGKKADIHFKVVDDGTYTVKDEKGETITEKEGYVPDIMCPAENGYGDYIIMNIDENGVIDKWEPWDITEFSNEPKDSWDD